ncbi:MAG: 3-phosphoshikimate 1-carboxyvinyltransferase [Rhodospirillales bacterium]|nr:3-phosphoshikimate 1-carboxyvinyltransferase [Rhodospirillales bacterium]
MAAPSDPFFDAMYERMSPGARYLFTAQQLDEIKKAFGARSWGSHAVDLRLTAPALRHSYYLVLLAGRDRCRVARARIRLPRAAALSAAAGLVTLAVLAAAQAFAG